MTDEGPARTPRHRRAGTWLAVLFLVSLPAVTPRIYASDEVQYFAYLRSLWFDRDVSFENEYRWFYDHGIARSAGFHETFLERTTETGRRINFATIGCAILWSPFYAVADIGARVAHGLAPPVARDGYSGPYVAAVAYGSAIYGWLAIVLGLRMARRLGLSATPAALAVWFGTPLAFYMYVAPPMSHACSAFAVALFLTVWLEVRGTWSARGMVGLGLAGALMAMVREQDLFFVVGPAIDFAVDATRRARDRAASGGPTLATMGLGALSGTAAFAAGFLPQALAYYALNGYVGPSQLVTRKMTWTAPHALGVLASPAHGFLVWTPLAALAIAGLVALALRRPRFDEAAAGSGTTDGRRVAWCLLAMVLFQVWVAGSVESWTVAGAFGQRRFVATSAMLVVGLAGLLTLANTRGRQMAAGAAVALAVWWNLGLMIQFGAGLMDRQRMEPARNAYTTFVVLPRRLPDLAWRYVFDRPSFYEGVRRERETR
ncbi:MAG: hypothetical protein KJ066_17585 [Acidobacteria bacterium]|nr:hypothetical protein [Acidobacteriota bacterium]